MLIRLIAHGQPVSAKNGKRAFYNPNTKTSHVARSEAVIAWYNTQVPKLRAQFEQLGMATITNFVQIEMHQYLQHHVMAKPSPDGDNVEGACFDALVKAGVLEDDKLVIDCHWRRAQHARPRVEIEIRVLGTTPELP